MIPSSKGLTTIQSVLMVCAGPGRVLCVSTVPTVWELRQGEEVVGIQASAPYALGNPDATGDRALPTSVEWQVWAGARIYGAAITAAGQNNSTAICVPVLISTRG